MEHTDGLRHPDDRFVDVPDVNEYWGMEAARVVLDADILDDLALFDLAIHGQAPEVSADEVARSIAEQLTSLLV